MQQDPVSKWYTPTQRVIESPPGGGGYVILPNSFLTKNKNDDKGETAESYFAVDFFEACSLVKNKRHYLNIMNSRIIKLRLTQSTIVRFWLM